MDDDRAERNDDPQAERLLNPELKKGRDTTHDTERTRAPLEGTGAKEDQGEGWPIIWAVVTILCIAITLFLVM